MSHHQRKNTKKTPNRNTAAQYVIPFQINHKMAPGRDPPFGDLPGTDGNDILDHIFLRMSLARAPLLPRGASRGQQKFRDVPRESEIFIPVLDHVFRRQRTKPTSRGPKCEFWSAPGELGGHFFECPAPEPTFAQDSVEVAAAMISTDHIFCEMSRTAGRSVTPGNHFVAGLGI